MNENQELQQAVLHGLLNQQQYAGNEMLAPKLLVNDEHGTIWEHLLDEFEKCQSFSIAVAFITQDMLTPFKAVMSELAARNVSGNLLTSDYLGFNAPEMFAELLKIPNLSVKITEVSGFHTKGYMFDNGDQQTMIVGSANLTRSAMLSNYEWNLRLTSTSDGALFQQVSQQFKRQWQTAGELTTDWLADYAANYVKPEWRPHQVSGTKKVPAAHPKITPNHMQEQALANLAELRQKEARRALLISATGTGKTYLGAFDVQAFAPRRFLFVVHREQILEAARDSFRNVLGGPATDFGLLSGNMHQKDAKYLFATIQTISKPEVLQQFDPQEFDYLMIDEAHRSGAASYQRLLAYFEPQFTLGMTATPERTDEFDVFKLFDHNIAYEVRLQQALAEDMLCPFHYIGVTDYEADGELIDETSTLSRLVSPQRVQYILQQLDYYGDSSHAPHGLIFCSRQDEAVELAELLTARHHPSQALTNQQTISQRDQAVARLEQGELEYLVTVNIFNEGIDIPCVDQVILLRNTQSSIVFIQQLGRGLRKYPGKDYVTVLDFIGNYKNNYLIPLALHDDHSSSKDRAKRELAFKPILGLSTISFSPIAKERIFAALDAVKLDSLRELKAAFAAGKQRLGRAPLLCDYLAQDSLDPRVFLTNSRVENYAQFLAKVREPVELTTYQDQLLTFVSQELALGKRPHELILLTMLLRQQTVSEEELLGVFEEKGYYYNAQLLNSLDLILGLDFFAIKSGKKLKADDYGGQALVDHDGFNYQLAPAFQAALTDAPDFSRLLNDALECGLKLSEAYDNTQQFTLYRRYTRKDVCRLLNWDKDLSAPMYGYWVGEQECPIFITYRKDEKVMTSRNYQNSLANNTAIRWYTRSPRSLESAEVQRLLAVKANGTPQVKLHIFAKRSDAEGKGYTYLGPATIDRNTVAEETMTTDRPKPKRVVGMNLKFTHPLLYHELKYLTGNQD